MSNPSEGVKDLLVAGSVGAFGPGSGWRIFIAKEPTSPDTVVTVYDTGGLTPNPKWLLDFPSVQVRVRGAKGEYAAARVKAVEAKDVLLGIAAQTINGDGWRGINLVGDLVHIGFDQGERPMFTMNFALIIEPAASGQTNRTAI